MENSAMLWYTMNSTGAIAGKDSRGRFAVGNKIAKGRRGSRNKLGEKFLDALLAEWRRSGKKALERTAGDDPVAFVKVVAGLLPKEIAQTLNVGLQSEMRIRIETDNFSHAYDAWGKFL